MPFPADGSPRFLDDAVDRRDEALWRTRRLMLTVAGGAVTASVALGIVFAQALPGHSVSSASTTGGGGAPGGPAPAPSTSQPSANSGSGSQGATAPTQAPQPAPPAPAPTTPQVVSGGS